MENTITQEDINISERKCQVRRRQNQSQNIAILLYPDCDGHVNAFAKILKRYDYTYILHDKDTIESELEEHNLLGGLDGEELTEEDKELLKKKHYHILLHLPLKREPTQIAKELMIQQRFVQRVSSRDAMLMYLVHTGLYYKHQYSPDEVFSNRPSLFREALAKYSTDTEKLLKCIDIIQNKNCFTYTFAMQMLAREGLTAFALKYSSTIQRFVDETLAVRKAWGLTPRPMETVKNYDSIDDVLK